MIRAEPLVQVEFVRGESWMVMRRISDGLRPSLRRLERARRSVRRNELILEINWRLLLDLLFICLPKRRKVFVFVRANQKKNLPIRMNK